MNGIHDLGGMHGFGPIPIEADEPVFHAEWERRVLGLYLALGAWGKWNIDKARWVRESMDPSEYLATTYYEHWLFGIEELCFENGWLTREELDGRVAAMRREAAACPS